MPHTVSLWQTRIATIALSVDARRRHDQTARGVGFSGGAYSRVVRWPRWASASLAFSHDVRRRPAERSRTLNVGDVSKGLGRRQREILAKLANHRDNPPDYNGHDSWHKHWKTGEPMYSELPKSRYDQYPEWMTVRELADLPVNDFHRSDVESTRRAVHKLEVAGLVETTMICRNQQGQPQIGVWLT
jgi:hypothetical protein